MPVRTHAFKFIALAVLAGTALAWAPAVQAASPANAATSAQAASPQAFIQGMGDQVITYLKDGGMTPEVKKARLKEVLQTRFDMPTISRFALGKYWNQLTPAQQAEYQTLFENMVVSMYAERFASYNGQEFKVSETKPSENSDVLVMSSIVEPDGGSKDIPVNWRVRTKDGAPKIVDVTIQNVSMIITQRSEFDSLIQRNGGNPAVVLDHLRQRQGT